MRMFRRQLLIGAGALALVPHLAQAQAFPFVDVFIKAPSLLVLKNGLIAMATAIGADQFVDATLGVIEGAAIQNGIRWDSDIIPDLFSAGVDRGLHLNLRLSLHEPTSDNIARALNIKTAITQFVIGLPNTPFTIPAAVQTAFSPAARSYHTSGSGIVFISPAPNPQKQVWA